MKPTVKRPHSVKKNGSKTKNNLGLSTPHTQTYDMSPQYNNYQLLIASSSNGKRPMSAINK